MTKIKSDGGRERARESPSGNVIKWLRIMEKFETVSYGAIHYI